MNRSFCPESGRRASSRVPLSGAWPRKLGARQAIAVGEDLKHRALLPVIEPWDIYCVDDLQPAFALVLRDAEVQYLEDRLV